METNNNNKNFTKVIVFAPDRWGEITTFKHFYYTTYQLNHSASSALNGVEGHFMKYDSLLELTKELILKLDVEKEELKKYGYSDALRSRQLSAIVETIFCELYSTVDCTRRVLVSIYGNLRGISSKSTHKLFANAEEGLIDERVPIEIREALIKAQKDWYPSLQKIRVSLNHSTVGHCSETNGKISYMHPDLSGSSQNALVSDDIFVEIAEYSSKVNMFLGTVFRCLNNTLIDTPTVQICGFFGGRIYQRIVSPHEAIDFNSGTCKSYEWFEQNENPTCPFADTCGAYFRLKEKQRSDG
jgi:hypothetical protein